MSLIISLVLAIGVGVIAWFRPKLAFALLPLLLPAYLIRASIGPLPTTALELAVLTMFVVWLMQGGWKRAKAVSFPWRWPLSLWILAGLVAVIVSPVHMQALGLYRAYFIEPLFVFVMGLDLIKTNDDKRLLIKSVAAVTIILGLWALVQMLTGWGIPYPWTNWPGRRAVGPFPYPNALSLFVAPIVALAFADRMKALASKDAKTLIGNVLGWLTVAFGLLAILCAKSNGATVAVIVSAFATLLLTKKMWKWALAFALVVTLTVFASPLRNKAISVLSFHEWSGMVRTVMWDETVTMLRDRPVFGAGLAAYPTVILPYHKATWMEVFQYPHDIVLNLWSETGVMGVIAFAWILFAWLGLASEDNGTRHAARGTLSTFNTLAFAVIIAMLVQGLVDVPYFKNDLSILFWLLVLLTTTDKYETQSHVH
jgi:hypothetical protein